MKKLLNTLKNDVNLAILVAGISIILSIYSYYMVSAIITQNNYNTALNELHEVETNIEFDTTNYFWSGSYDRLVTEIKILNIEPSATLNGFDYYVVYNEASSENIIIKVDNENKDISYLGYYHNELSEADQSELIEVMQNL